MHLGNPLPTVEWTRVQGILPRQHVIQGGVLTIPRTREEDSGQYLCTASNEDGKTESVVVLTVNGRCPSID